jgi:hypothetical protein
MINYSNDDVLALKLRIAQLEGFLSQAIEDISSVQCCYICAGRLEGGKCKFIGRDDKTCSEWRFAAAALELLNK